MTSWTGAIRAFQRSMKKQLSLKTFLLISMNFNDFELKLLLQNFREKRNSHGHFKFIKKHKIIYRSCCLSAIMLLPYYFMLNSINIPLWWLILKFLTLQHFRKGVKQIEIWLQKLLTLMWLRSSSALHNSQPNSTTPRQWIIM